MVSWGFLGSELLPVSEKKSKSFSFIGSYQFDVLMPFNIVYYIFECLFPMWWGPSDIMSDSGHSEKPRGVLKISSTTCFVMFLVWKL